MALSFEMMLSVINVLTRYMVQRRKILMKKMIVLSPEEKKLDEEKILEFMKFAEKHGLNPAGETHYPPMFPMEMPEEFVEILKDRFDDCVYVMDDSCLIFANAYNDGKLLKLLEKNNITIIHKELESDLKRIFDVMAEDTIQHLKKSVTKALNELRNENEPQLKKVAVFYQDENDSELNGFVEGLSHGEEVMICAMCIPEYDECLKDAIIEVLKNNNISEAIIYDKKMVTPEFLEFLEESELDYHYREPDIRINITGMSLN